jgi:hypothetical protein
MSRRQKDPLRGLSTEEREELTRLSYSQSAPAAQVARATALLAVADGQSYLAAARQAARRDNDTVAAWVARFNREGLAAVMPRHGGGPPICYGAAEQRRILVLQLGFILKFPYRKDRKLLVEDSGIPSEVDGTPWISEVERLWLR